MWADGRPLSEASWLACERADWLLWIAARVLAPERKRVVWTACQCARTALKYTKDPCVLACIEMTERWCRDQATIEEVRKARHAAAAAAYAAYAANAAYADAAADAADAAANAAYAADAAAYAANAAAAAAAYAANAANADAAAYAANAAAAAYAANAANADAAAAAAYTADADADAHREMCTIVRREIPWERIERRIRS